MPRKRTRLFALIAALALVAAACGGDDSADDATPDGGTQPDDSGTDDDTGDTGDSDAEPDDSGTDDGGDDDVDYEALGLWDDGNCDASRDPLVVGIMTVFESPLLSLKDQATALEAAAEAFNTRGGANGACITVVACDDGADFDQAIACVRELDGAGVVASLNDQGSTAQAEVSAGMAEAGIPRIGVNVTPDDWADPNSYPTDASGIGVTFLMPEALIREGITEIGIVRVDLPEAGAMRSMFETLFTDKGATFPVDVPVPAGTTSYSQFILAAEDGNAGGIILANGEQEAIQVVRAGQQLGTELWIGASLGTFSHSTVADLGDIAAQMLFLGSFPPATADVPVYDVLLTDLAASDEEALQPENLKTSPMRSWISLYALLWMIRDAGLTEFSRDGVTTLLNEAEDVPMLGLFGGEDWTPSFDREGVWKRVGTDRWTSWTWDPEATWDGNPGNFVLVNEISFDDVMCGSLLGAPGPC